MEKLKELYLFIVMCLMTILCVICAMCYITRPVERIHQSENRRRPAITITKKEEPKKIMTAIKPASKVFSERIVKKEEPEEPEEIKWLTVMATAYTDAEEENGGYGAHDCKYGFDLVDGEHIASDLSFLPYGTKVYIEGLGERTVVDTASNTTIQKVNRMARDRGCDGWIDVFMGNRTQDMNDWGITIVRLYIIE